MKKMRNIILTILILFFCVAISSCEGDKAENILQSETATEEGEDMQGEQNNSSKEDIFRTIIEQHSPSDLFASGTVFDISRQQCEAFEQAVNSKDELSLFMLFADAYSLFINNPETVGFSPDWVNIDNDDTDPKTWEANIVDLSTGDHAALLFMPIQHETLTAKIVGIVFSDKGDGYYYCMLNKDENMPSEVYRNNAMDGIKKAGEVEGLGFELRDSFVDCITDDFQLGM